MSTRFEVSFPVFAVLALVALAACGQSDPDDVGATGGTGGTDAAGMAGGGMAGGGMAGSDTAGAGGSSAGGSIVEAASYFPLVDGATWVYLHQGGRAGDWEDTVTMSAITYMEEPAFLTQDTPGPNLSTTDSILQRRDSVVFRVHKEVEVNGMLSEIVDYTPGFPRFDEAWRDVAEGFRETREYRREQFDGVTTQQVFDEMRAHDFTIESTSDSVSVPAGDFDGCVRVRRFRVRAPGDPSMTSDEKLFWFCAGVGKVREEEPMSGQSEVLLSCTVPGGACP